MKNIINRIGRNIILPLAVVTGMGLNGCVETKETEIKKGWIVNESFTGASYRHPDKYLALIQLSDNSKEIITLENYDAIMAELLYDKGDTINFIKITDDDEYSPGGRSTKYYLK